MAWKHCKTNIRLVSDPLSKYYSDFTSRTPPLVLYFPSPYKLTGITPSFSKYRLRLKSPLLLKSFFKNLINFRLRALSLKLILSLRNTFTLPLLSKRYYLPFLELYFIYKFMLILRTETIESFLLQHI